MGDYKEKGCPSFFLKEKPEILQNGDVKRDVQRIWPPRDTLGLLLLSEGWDGGVSSMTLAFVVREL